jgi:hypothetical protein
MEREKAYHSAKIYKERTKRWHDKGIIKKELNPGDQVLLFKLQGSTLWAWEATKQVGRTIQGGELIVTRSRHSSRRRRYVIHVNGQRIEIFLELNKEFENLDEIDFFCFPTNINFRS